MKNFLVRVNLFFIALSFSLFMFPPLVFSVGIGQVPMPTSCGTGGQDVQYSGNTCIVSYTGGRNGIMLYGTGAKFEAIAPISNYITGLMNGAYPPYTGDFRTRTFACPMQSAGKCTMAKSSGSAISAKSAFFDSSNPISIGNGPTPGFGGSGQYFDPGTTFSICVTLVDPQDHDWRDPTDSMFCSDATVMPSKPATCYMNYDGSDLNVDLGSLERGMIATQPLTTTPTTKQVQILCTANAGVNLTMEFQYTPLSINGVDTVGTSTPGLGVAVIYQGKVVSPTDKFQLAYTVGYNQLDLDFEAIRDPSINVGNIAAGPFTGSNLVVVMTE